MNPAQQRLALQVIAGHADTLNRLLMLLQNGVSDDSPVIDAAQFMATVIGGLADDASGETVMGDMRDWMYGPLFTSGVAV